MSMVRCAGELWVATKFHGTFAISTSPGKRPEIVRELELEGARARGQWVDAFRGGLWIATDGGLLNYSPEQAKIVSAYGQKQGLPSDSVRWVGEIEGSVWAATNRGACRLDPGGRWVLYGSEQGLPSVHVFRMIRDRDTLWASCIGGGLAAWEPASGRWREIPMERGLGNKTIYAIVHGSMGLWLGTAGGVNLYLPAERSWDEPVCSDGFTDYCVYDAAEIDGELWFATGYGLYRRRLKDGRQWVYGTRHGLPSAETSALLAERDGLWVGTAKGLALINTGKL